MGKSLRKPIKGFEPGSLNTFQARRWQGQRNSRNICLRAVFYIYCVYLGTCPVSSGDHRTVYKQWLDTECPAALRA